MTKILLFSDLHAHNFQYGASYIECPAESGDAAYSSLNSRLVDTVLILREIRRAVVQNKVDIVLFGGDLFHTRGSVDTDVVTVIASEIAKFGTLGVPFYMLQGNHDFADRSGNITSIDFLDHLPGVSVLEPGWNEFPNLRVYAVPYVQDLAGADTLLDLKKVEQGDKLQILLGHLGIQGAKVGSDYVLVSNTDIDFKELNTKAFDASFFGHFHKHQKLGKNAWYIGATHEHNWGDAGQHLTRGYMLADVEKGSCSVEFVPTCSAPRFVKVRNEKDLAKVRANDFVRVIRTHTGCESNFEANLVEEVSKLATKVEELEETEVTIGNLPKELFDPLAMVEEWVTLHGDSDPELLSLGSELLSEALGEEL